METPATQTATGAACPTCHLAVQPTYYYCPNCGTNLKPVQLPTDAAAQAKLYLHSIIMPLILFLTISKWQGIRYYRSVDPAARRIGVYACALLLISTVFTIWFSVVSVEAAVNATTKSLNDELNLDGF